MKLVDLAVSEREVVWVNSAYVVCVRRVLCKGFVDGKLPEAHNEVTMADGTVLADYSRHLEELVHELRWRPNETLLGGPS